MSYSKNDQPGQVDGSGRTTINKRDTEACPLKRQEEEAVCTSSSSRPNKRRKGILGRRISKRHGQLSLATHSISQKVKSGRPKNQMEVKLRLTRPDTLEEYSIKALLDSGTTSSIVSQKFVIDNDIPIIPLENITPVYNANGSQNAAGPICSFVRIRMTIDDHEELIDLYISNIQKHDVYLGYEWLGFHNPTINWQAGSIKLDHCPTSCGNPLTEEHYVWVYSILLDDIKEDERVIHHDIHIWAKVNISTKLAAREEAKKEIKTWKEIVLSYYHDFEDVFTKEDFDNLPSRQKWDHTIELIPEALPEGEKKHGKVYSLTLDERQELKKFLEENKHTGRIRESNSRFASSFFFIKKKDGRLRPVQDYRLLNKWTIKN